MVKKTTVVPAAPTPVPETPVPVPAAEPGPATDQYVEVIASLDEVLKTVRALVQKVRIMKKENDKLRKQKTKTKRESPKGDRPPSGFAKPAGITDQLCTFLGVEKGTLLSRTEVTSRINKYIKDNDLRKAEDKRQIVPDKKLAAILSAKKGDEVTYFNLQKYLKHQFVPTPTA